MHFPNISQSNFAAVLHNRPADELYLFGNSVHARRHELGLSLFEAADLSGLTIWQWAAIEEGSWIPSDHDQIRAMAGTLEANALQMILVASLSAWAQSGYKSKHPQL